MKKLLYSILLLIPLTLNGQNEVIENNKVAVDSLFFANPEKALEICENSLPNALQSNDTILITYFLDQAGELNRMMGNYDLALHQLNNCLVYKENWTDLKDLSITHNNLGKTYGQKGQYELAVYHFLEALHLMEKDENLLGQSFYLNNLAAIYDLQHNYQQAIIYYERSLKIKSALRDEKGIAASFTNLGISYFNLGDLDKSLAYHEQAYSIYLDIQDTTRMVRTLSNMGRTLIEKTDFVLANQKLSEALMMDAGITDQKLRMDLYNNLGLVKVETGEFEGAIQYLDKAELLAHETNAWSILKSNFQIRSKLAQENENYSEALDYLNKSILYNDSLINEANIYAVADMREKYEYEKNKRIISENELAISQKQNLIEQQRFWLTLWSGIGMIAILIVLIFIFLYFGKRRNNRLLEGQLTLISNKNAVLDRLNHEIRDELNKTQISLEERERLINTVFEKSKTKELPPELLSLSKREIEVLSYLALGWSDDQLANKLFISKSTVKTHLRRIYSKLLVRGRAEAVNIAHKYDLLGNGLS